MKYLIFAFMTSTFSMGHALETQGPCANEATKAAYQAIVEDMFTATSSFAPIYTLSLNMKTESSKLIKETSIVKNHGNIYSVVIKDLSSNKNVEVLVEFTSTGCALKSAEQVLSGEE